MRKLAIIGAALVALAIIPSVASASGYNLTQKQAQRDARTAAYDLYTFGSDPVHTYCYPQGHRPSGGTPRYPGYYHRWGCVWVGGGSYGLIRVAGNSDGDFSYRVILGMRDQ